MVKQLHLKRTSQKNLQKNVLRRAALPLLLFSLIYLFDKWGFRR